MGNNSSDNKVVPPVKQVVNFSGGQAGIFVDGVWKLYTSVDKPKNDSKNVNIKVEK